MESEVIKSSAALTEFYEQLTRGEIPIDFDKIGFLNIGYWKGVEDSVEVAQIKLIETLVSFFSKREGTVLDVACGKGVSTKFLTKYFDPQNITGINISEAQLRICKLWAPECAFHLMDATNMEFADASFDNVLCIEAAQHFRTRYRFLEEAYRVLAPGGRLAMHDMILHRQDRITPPNPEIWPEDNYRQNLDAYRDDLSRVGFRHVRVEDITEFSMTAVMQHLVRKLEGEFDRRQNHKALAEAVSALSGNSPWMPGNCTWCMAYAIK